MILNEPEIYPSITTDLSDRDSLILSPHPDDESIGCGGSIIRHVKRGSRVKVIFLTSGEKGDFEQVFGEHYTGKRRDSAMQALSALGVKEFEFLDFNDRGLYQVKDEALVRVREAVKSFRPGLIYAPSPFEAHPDHRTASGIGMELYNESGIDTAFYEVLMPLYPNILVDISGVYESKETALKCYDTENYYNKYVSLAEGLNRVRTATLGSEIRYAEAFVLFNEEYRAGRSCRFLQEIIKIRTAGLR